MPCGAARSLTVNALALEIAEWGRGDARPLLLLHSLAAHLHWWDWTAPLWAPQHHVVALDFRGHGGSAHADPPAYGFDEHASDAAGVLSALSLDRVVLIGHSMGAFVGALVAARYPERVEALVMADMLSGWTAEQAAAAAPQPQPEQATTP